MFHVLIPVCLLRKTLVAAGEGADVGFLLCVHAEVVVKVVPFLEALKTGITDQRIIIALGLRVLVPVHREVRGGRFLIFNSQLFLFELLAWDGFDFGAGRDLLPELLVWN